MEVPNTVIAHSVLAALSDWVIGLLPIFIAKLGVLALLSLGILYAPFPLDPH